MVYGVWFIGAHMLLLLATIGANGVITHLIVLLLGIRLLLLGTNGVMVTRTVTRTNGVIAARHEDGPRAEVRESTPDHEFRV